MKEIALIGCGKKKAKTLVQAQYLYQGFLFVYARNYCKKHYKDWYILSAKYGLVRPSEEVSPYDLTLKSMSKGEREEWGIRVKSQLESLGLEDSMLVVHAGEGYVKPLVAQGLTIKNPLKGLSIGKRLRWYKTQKTY